MSEQSVRAAIIDALGRVVPLRAEWTVRLQDSSFDLPIADLAIDSLDTLELCMEIEASTGVELEPAELVTVATIDELIGLVASKDRRAPASLIQAPRDQPLPLSLAQESIWNYCQALENPAAYVLGRIDKIEGPLDIAKLGECLGAIVSRHEILRTTFPVWTVGQFRGFILPRRSRRRYSTSVATKIRSRRQKGSSRPHAHQSRIWLTDRYAVSC